MDIAVRHKYGLGLTARWRERLYGVAALEKGSVDFAGETRRRISDRDSRRIDVETDEPVRDAIAVPIAQ